MGGGRGVLFGRFNVITSCVYKEDLWFRIVRRIITLEPCQWGDNFEKCVSKVLISGRNFEIHWLSVVEHCSKYIVSKTVTDGSIVLDSFAIAKQSFHVWHYSKYYDFVIKRGERFGYERYTFLVLLVVCDHKYRSNRTIRQWIFVNYYYNFQTDLHTFIKSWKE